MKYLKINPSSALSAVMMSSILLSGTARAEVESGLSYEESVYGSTYRNTATKNALPPEKTPQGYSIIDQEDIQQKGHASVAEALRYTTGVNTQLRGGAVTRADLYNVRGFNNDKTYYDGLPLFNNQWNLVPQIDPINIEQVEVFKGPTSVLYGAMPPGGMVNIISNPPSRDPSTKLHLSTGTGQLFETGIQSKGAVTEHVNYSVDGLVKNKDGQANTSKIERRMIAPQIDWQASENTLVNVNLYYQKDPSAGIYNTLPAKGLFLANQNGQLPTDAYMGDKSLNTYDRDVTILGYKINHNFSDNWRYLNNFKYFTGKAYQENTYSTGLASDEKTLGRRAYLTDEKSNAWAMDNQLSGQFTLGNTQHDVLLGLDYQTQKSNIKYEDTAISSIDLFATNNNSQIDRSTVSFQNTAYSSDFDRTYDQLGVYIQDQVTINHLIVMAGLRKDKYKGKEEGKKYGTQSKTSNSHDPLTGRVGILYSFDSGLAPFISYAQGFEPQTGKTRNGQEFDVSESTQIELGTKFRTANQKTDLTVSAYNIEKSNVPTRDPSGGPNDVIQAGEITSKGIELELNQQITDALSVNLAVTRQDVEITKDNNGLQGKTPIRTPDTIASAWTNYNVVDGALAGSAFGIGVRYVGKAQINETNTGKVPSATLIDASASHDVNAVPGLALSLSASNLANKRHYSCYDASNCWFGATRSIKASASYEF